MGTEWSRPTKYVVGVGLALFFVFVLYLSRSIIPLLVVAGLIAFAVNPLIRFLQEQLRFPRGPAIAVTYLAVLLLLPLAGLLLATAITQAIQFVISIDYATLVTSTSATLRDWLIQLQTWPIPFAPLDEYVDGLVDLVLETLSGANEAVDIQFPSFAELVSQLGSVLTITFGAVAGLLGNLFSSAIVFIFVFLSSIYLTTSAAGYRDAMVRALPERFRPEMLEYGLLGEERGDGSGDKQSRYDAGQGMVASIPLEHHHCLDDGTDHFGACGVGIGIKPGGGEGDEIGSQEDG